MTTRWMPEQGEEYAEIWLVSWDRSVAVYPDSVAGQERPGADALLQWQMLGQRGKAQGRVRAYGRAFGHGHSPTTWDAMAITPDGLLANGMHRLTAVVETQATIKMLVLLNVSEAAIDLGDQGQGRSVEQTLRRLGYEHPTVTAPAARMLYRWQEGRSPGDRKDPVTWDDVKYVLDFHDLDAYGHHGRLLGEKGRLHSNGLGAMLAYFIHQIAPRSGSVFLQRWLDDDIRSGRDPVHHLRRWLENEHAAAKGTKGGADVTEKAAMVILAWNAEIRGEEPERIIWRLRGRRAPEFPKFLLPDDYEPGEVDLSQFTVAHDPHTI